MVVPEERAGRVIYVKNDCKDIWDWAEKVYGVIEKMKNGTLPTSGMDVGSVP